MPGPAGVDGTSASPRSRPLRRCSSATVRGDRPVRRRAAGGRRPVRARRALGASIRRRRHAVAARPGACSPPTGRWRSTGSTRRPTGSLVAYGAVRGRHGGQRAARAAHRRPDEPRRRDPRHPRRLGRLAAGRSRASGTPATRRATSTTATSASTRSAPIRPTTRSCSTTSRRRSRGPTSASPPTAGTLLVEVMVGWSRIDVHLLDVATGVWHDVIDRRRGPVDVRLPRRSPGRRDDARRAERPDRRRRARRTRSSGDTIVRRARRRARRARRSGRRRARGRLGRRRRHDRGVRRSTAQAGPAVSTTSGWSPCSPLDADAASGDDVRHRWRRSTRRRRCTASSTDGNCSGGARRCRRPTWSPTLVVEHLSATRRSTGPRSACSSSAAPTSTPSTTTPLILTGYGGFAITEIAGVDGRPRRLVRRRRRRARSPACAAGSSTARRGTTPAGAATSRTCSTTSTRPPTGWSPTAWTSRERLAIVGGRTAGCWSARRSRSDPTWPGPCGARCRCSTWCASRSS